jgi:6-pyruvoyltetrahydropterin/6-carboxytetrahydropterin synthase
VKYILEIKKKFDAAHKLSPEAGKCSRLHGHTWEIIIKVKTEFLTNDWVMDCHKLQDIVDKLIDSELEFDHNYLNDISPFIGNFYPTMERIAEVIYQKLKDRFIHPVELESVTINEGGESKVTVKE